MVPPYFKAWKIAGRMPNNLIVPFDSNCEKGSVSSINMVAKYNYNLFKYHSNDISSSAFSNTSIRLVTSI